MKDFQGERMTKCGQSHRMVFFVGASLLRSLAAGRCLLVATDSLSFLFFWVHTQQRQQQHLSFEIGQRHYISSFLNGMFSQQDYPRQTKMTRAKQAIATNGDISIST